MYQLVSPIQSKVMDSMSWPGDPRITEVIERHKEEILESPEWVDNKDEYSCQLSVMIPPLPALVTSLNGTAMKSIIRGLMKQHKLKWSSPQPEWWPRQIPFENVSTHHLDLNEIGVQDLNKSLSPVMITMQRHM